MVANVWFTRPVVDARARFVQETDADLLNILDRLGEPAELPGQATESPLRDQPLRAG